LLFATVFSKEVRNGNLQTNGQSFDILERDVAGAAFNIRYVSAMNVGSLRETLLREFKFVPPFSNGSSKPAFDVWLCFSFDGRIKAKCRL